MNALSLWLPLFITTSYCFDCSTGLGKIRVMISSFVSFCIIMIYYFSVCLIGFPVLPHLQNFCLVPGSLNEDDRILASADHLFHPALSCLLLACGAIFNLTPDFSSDTLLHLRFNSSRLLCSDRKSVV